MKVGEKYKFFIASDIHSGFSEWQEALKENGYEEDNPYHKLVICGDAFDRLTESFAMYNYLVKAIKEDKLIYVLGNHEILAYELLKTGRPRRHDFHNGTVQTFTDICDGLEIYSIEELREPLGALLKNCVYYLETEDYVMVHSWYPENYEWDEDSKEVISPLEYMHTAPYSEWENCVWVNPFSYSRFSRKKEERLGKILIHGHFSNYEEWAKREGKTFTTLEEIANYKHDAVIHGAHDDCIGLDGCTVLSHKVPIWVVEDTIVSIGSRAPLGL